MKVLRAPAELDAGARPVCAAIGVFDGVHLGHQEVLRQTIAEAARHGAVSVAITFDRHPSQIVAPRQAPPLLYSLAKKLEVLGSLGLDATCVIRFDAAFSQIAAPTFVHDLATGFKRLENIFVGGAFQFGRGRSGNVAMLQRLGLELGFAVQAVPEVDLDGRPVSSTRIREAVRDGDFACAGRMLGRPYTLSGTVVTGQNLGRKLGFPTANLRVTGLLTPPRGVYAGAARVGNERHRAAINIGYRPTVAASDPQLHVEAHLLDFSGDLAGGELELEFWQKVREEKKFPSLEALRAQIEADVARIRGCPAPSEN